MKSLKNKNQVVINNALYEKRALERLRLLARLAQLVAIRAAQLLRKPELVIHVGPGQRPRLAHQRNQEALLEERRLIG